MSRALKRNSPARRAEWVTKKYGLLVSVLTFEALSHIIGASVDIIVPRKPREPSPFDPLPSIRVDDNGFYLRGAWPSINDVVIEWLEREWGKRRSPADKLWPWVARELNRVLKEAPGTTPSIREGWGVGSDQAYCYVRGSALFADLYDAGPLLIEWQEKTHADIMKVDAATAIDEARAWSEQEDTSSPGPPGKVVAELSDGWTAVDLPVESLRAEGEIMQNCLQHGYYDGGVSRGSSIVYSLRDSLGRPHVDVAVTGLGRLIEARAKQNAEPVGDYADKTEEAIGALKIAAPEGPLTREEQDYLRTETETRFEDDVFSGGLPEAPGAHSIVDEVWEPETGYDLAMNFVRRELDDLTRDYLRRLREEADIDVDFALEEYPEDPWDYLYMQARSSDFHVDDLEEEYRRLLRRA